MELTDAAKTIGIRLATDCSQIQACYIIMRQLRPHLISEQTFVEQVQRQLQEGYHLAYIEEEGVVRALAGFRFLEFLAWGKAIYIDDLISDAATRKKGYGTKLLQWVISEAKKAKCDQVHLDSGPQRHDAHRLYLKPWV